MGYRRRHDRRVDGCLWPDVVSRPLSADFAVIIVRVLLFSALATIAGALIMYLIKRDRRYLRFIGQVAKYSVVLLLAVFMFLALRRVFLQL